MAGILENAVVEIEAHVGAAGWDRPPTMFAFVRAGLFAAQDPVTAARLGLDRLPAEAVTPVEQEELPDQPLDELLAGIEWPASVDGCAVTQEIVILPPGAEAGLDGTDDDVARAAQHPQRREARLVVGVLRDGSSLAVLRMRPRPDADPDADADTNPDPDSRPEDLLTGADLAPNLVEALLATLR